MKVIILTFFIFFKLLPLFAQNFTGQWKGEFVDKSTSFTGWGGDRCEYILEIEVSGTTVSGYSYTYFFDGGKRYYTICKLSGTFNKGNKYIEVRETERTKTNVPLTIRNCFQIHKLSYTAGKDEQKLEGTWTPMPNQEGDCGFGTTLLSRRVLQKNPEYYNNSTTKNKPANKPKIIDTKAPVLKTTPKNITPPVIVKSAPQKKITPPEIKKITEPPTAKVPQESAKTITQEASKNIPSLKTQPAEVKAIDPKYQKRNNEVIKTIEIDNIDFTVDLYDNGEIDGDSVSLFFNGSLILSHKRLSDKALRLKLNVDKSRDVNELIMYAENLGTIPPNTALMVVNDGDNRYEVRISSDLQKSGVIRFVHKPKKAQ